MRIAAILFDLNETLHSREAAFWAWLREEAGTRELDTQRIATFDARGRGPKAMLLEYLAHELLWAETRLEERLHRFRTGLLRHTMIDPRVLEMLGRLQASFRLGVVSNGASSSQRSKIQALQLERYFDPIIISEEVGFRKPDPEIFWLAANRWSVPRQHVLVVGDDEGADVQGAVSAGMQALLVCGERPCGPGSISHVTDLEQWLRTHAASESA